MKNRKESKQRWSVISMIGLIIATIIVSPFGIVFGAMNFKYTGRKKQGLVLIAIGLVMTIMWIIHFAGMHGHHH